MIPLLIGAWITISPLPQQNIDRTVVLVEFREEIPDMFLPDNYQLKDENNEYHIYSVNQISELDGWQIKYTKVVALVVEKLKAKNEYTVDVKSIGKSTWFFFNGFLPNRIETPAAALTQ